MDLTRLTEYSMKATNWQSGECAWIEESLQISEAVDLLWSLNKSVDFSGFHLEDVATIKPDENIHQWWTFQEIPKRSNSICIEF